jgi:hypothetical protein
LAFNAAMPQRERLRIAAFAVTLTRGGLVSELEHERLMPEVTPEDYIGQGDSHNCAHVSSQADAQSVLRADRSDPNRLDADKAGVACERPAPPQDFEAVLR